jgi:hypothetical protein
MDQTEKIRANEEMVIKQLRPLGKIDFGYNKESVHWLEGYIERLRRGENFESQKNKFASVFGSFLGECIIRCYGGKWGEQNGSLGMIFETDNVAFPFNKIRKQLDNGLEDGIGSFFDTIEVLFKIQLKREAPMRTSWWKLW